MNANTLRLVIAATPANSLGALATSLFTARACEPAAWLECFGPHEKEAATHNAMFLQPLLLTSLTSDDLNLLIELEALADRPVAIVVKSDMPTTVPDYVVCAGGSVARATAHIMRGEGTPLAVPSYSDIDYFVTPAFVDAGGAAVLATSSFVVSAASCVTVVPDDFTQPLVQVVVHERANDWRRLVADFDFVHVQVAQVGAVAYASAAAVKAWRTRVTAVPRTRLSLYIKRHRYGKSFAEGFKLDDESWFRVSKFYPPTPTEAIELWQVYKQNALDLITLQRQCSCIMQEIGADIKGPVMVAMAQSLKSWRLRRPVGTRGIVVEYTVHDNTTAALRVSREFAAKHNDKFNFCAQYVDGA